MEEGVVSSIRGCNRESKLIRSIMIQSENWNYEAYNVGSRSSRIIEI